MGELDNRLLNSWRDALLKYTMRKLPLKSMIDSISRNHPFDRTERTTSQIGDFSTDMRKFLLTPAILLSKIL
jgi:hypothetical protein